MSQIQSTPMTLKERVLHSILFELGAITLATVLVLAFSDVQAGSAIGVSVVMAVMATVWNFVFNYGFDKVFTAPRETRGFGLRVFHTVAFETGLLAFTIPVIAYLLGLYCLSFGLDAVAGVFGGRGIDCCHYGLCLDF
ncbi:Predicted membrane protein [Moraxella lacunata]|uniref:Predicted membrane protein n=1 Tax=Moraxella lacunata TaxID=477 RepID=A0A378QJ04_MORLA|nr:PACE efflux transporter [Moraxella lacunata]STZ00462.1 Predicted membrane protein [Moraxella lacunata]